MNRNYSSPFYLSGVFTPALPGRKAEGVDGESGPDSEKKCHKKGAIFDEAV